MGKKVYSFKLKVSTKTYLIKPYYPHVSVAFLGDHSRVLAIGMVSSIVLIENRADKFKVIKLVKIYKLKGLTREALSCFRFINKHPNDIADIKLILGFKSGLIGVYHY